MNRPTQRRRAWWVLLAVLAIDIARVPAAGTEEIVVELAGVATRAQELGAKTATLCIEDVQGTYTIPYIQSSRDLHVRVVFADPLVVTAELSVARNGTASALQQATRGQPSVCFANLNPGEYSLQCRGLDRDSREQSRTTYSRIGIGTVIAALGDSITEGYFGRGSKQDDLNLTADRFPPASVSRDGRNFPQFAPTTAQHLPAVNCFESWMTPLNNSLAHDWQQPVFIANEGVGGITCGGYLRMMRNDAGWKKRMLRLEPRIWLVHLGVNDERAKIRAVEVRANLAAMIALLINEYYAKPAHIFLCLPCYDYVPGAAEILRGYASEIEGLISRRGLSRGPDFYAAFAQDKQRWYGNDPVHPNLEGMTRMAELWHEALVRQLPSGPRD